MAVAGLAGLVLAGCGSTAARPDPVREARLVAEMNSLCRQRSGHEARYAAQHPAAVARLRALYAQLGQVALYLPAGRTLARAHAERSALSAEYTRIGQGSGWVNVTGRPHLIERFYRIQLEIYDADRALGLTACLGAPPRRPIGG